VVAWFLYNCENNRGLYFINFIKWYFWTHF
jgi:hypothetical protein